MNLKYFQDLIQAKTVIPYSVSACNQIILRFVFV